MEEKMKNLLLRSILLITFCLILFGSTYSLVRAADLETIRNYLEMRDALLILKIDIEQALLNNPDAQFLKNPNAEIEISSSLSFFEHRISGMTQMEFHWGVISRRKFKL